MRVLNNEVSKEKSLLAELTRVISDSNAILRIRWAKLTRHSKFVNGDDGLEMVTQLSYTPLWEKMLKALYTDLDKDYLSALKEEGRIQAREANEIQQVVQQINELLNLIWEVIGSTLSLEQNPGLLKFLAQRLNKLRIVSEKAILTGYLEEQNHLREKLILEDTRTGKPPLAKVDLAEFVRKINSFTLARYFKGQTIFKPGTTHFTLYFIMLGKVRLYELLPDGRSVTLSILDTRDVFAEFNRSSSYFHEIYAEAMQDSILVRFQQSSLDTLLEHSPLLATQVITRFSQQLSQSELLIERLLGPDASLRLIVLLLKLAKEFGIANSDGNKVIDLRVTRQELANLAGTNQVTVTRQLQELQEKQLIEISRRNIILKNQEELEQLLVRTEQE
jgi:CRP/FNR family transcriptional regulator